MTIDLLKGLTNLNIKNLEFEDLKNMGDSTGYDFSTIKLKVDIEENSQKDSSQKCELQNDNNLEVNLAQSNGTKADIYIRMIRKDRIKESIFCYWSLLYDEKFKSYEESEFTSVINKVKITETENETYKHSVLLEIKENKWGILEYGTTIHLVKLEKYLNDTTIKKSNLTNEWKKYLEDGNEDVLFIGVVN